jgi:uncharacterized protein
MLLDSNIVGSAAKAPGHTFGPELRGLLAMSPRATAAKARKMTVHPTDHAGLEILPFADCMRLLGTVPVGRVGFLADGEVVMLPVNHLTDRQTVLFRSRSGSKLSSVGSKNQVGFEADDYDRRTHSGWSVVVSGFTEVVEDDDEIRRLEHLGLQSWGAAGDDASWIRIRPTSVTGRRTSGAAFAG